MEVVTNSGIWGAKATASHRFLLSPDVYVITEGERKELEALGMAIYDCMLGLSQIAVIAYDGTMNYGGRWAFCRKVFSTGVPRTYRELQGMRVRDIPRLLKVDLMVGLDGKFKIAEIDGHNKHGLGYSTLGLRFREAIHGGEESLPGVVRLLADEVRRLGFEELTLLYADQERFYVPEFEVAKAELEKHGIHSTVVGEMEAKEVSLSEGLFLDLPFLYKRPDLYTTIVSAYKAGRAQFIIPPKPFLGAKGALALLRNDRQDPHLEGMLRAFIHGSSLDLVRQYTPETFLVGTTRFVRWSGRSRDGIRARMAEKKYVLKESISSGMKGIFFSDEDGFEEVLSRASATKANWILQEEVVNRPQRFSWFENGAGREAELQTADDWLMRVTVHYVNRKLADGIVTARRNRAVHGATDCLQLGVIVR